MTWLHLHFWQDSDIAAPFAYTMFTLNNILSNEKLEKFKRCFTKSVKYSFFFGFFWNSIKVFDFFLNTFIKSKTFFLDISVIPAFVAKTWGNKGDDIFTFIYSSDNLKLLFEFLKMRVYSVHLLLVHFWLSVVSNVLADEYPTFPFIFATLTGSWTLSQDPASVIVCLFFLCAVGTELKPVHSAQKGIESGKESPGFKINGGGGPHWSWY